MTYQEILSELKQKKFRPIYLLYGDEPYFIDKLTDYISKNILDEGEREFNQTILYGRDAAPDQIIETAKRFPMMANHQVVIVKEAQNIRNLDAFEKYAEQPLESTILVFAYKYKKPDKRKKVVKAMAKSGVVFESKTLYDSQIPDWVQQYLHSSGHTITPKASLLVSEFLGNDLSKISNELDKLLLNLDEGKKIDDHDIEKNIGISKDYNLFELQKAIGNKDIFKAQQIALYFAQNPKNHPLVVTLSILSSFFSKVLGLYFMKGVNKMEVAKALKVNPYFADDYINTKRNFPAPKLVENISILKEYDLKSKGVSSGHTPDGELLKELIYKLLH